MLIIIVIIIKWGIKLIVIKFPSVCFLHIWTMNNSFNNIANKHRYFFEVLAEFVESNGNNYSSVVLLYGFWNFKCFLPLISDSM